MAQVDAKKTIRIIMDRDKVTLSKLAKACGVSRQEIYKRLNRNMTVGTFYQMIEALGYELVVGRMEDGKFKGGRAVEKVPEDNVSEQ